MLAGLKAHSGNIANTFRTQNLAELLKPCSRKRRKRFWQLRKFAEAYETAAPVCQFRNIFSGPAACDFLQEFGRETALHRGQHGSPPLGDIDYRSARWKGSNQTVEDALHAGTRSSAESNRVGSTPRVENARAFSCTALRSFSNSTMTIAMPSSICGIGPSKWPALPKTSR